MFTTHNYTISFLTLLLTHKKNKSTIPSLALLVEVLDGAIELNYQELDTIFYSDTSTGLNFEKRHQILKTIIQDCFEWVFYERGEVVRVCGVDEFSLTEKDEIWLLRVKFCFGFDQAELEKKRKGIVFELERNSFGIRNFRKIFGKRNKNCCDVQSSGEGIEKNKKKCSVVQNVKNCDEEIELNENNKNKTDVAGNKKIKKSEIKNENIIKIKNSIKIKNKEDKNLIKISKKKEDENSIKIPKNGEDGNSIKISKNKEDENLIKIPKNGEEEKLIKISKNKEEEKLIKISKNNILRFVTLKQKEVKIEHKKFTSIDYKFVVVETVRKSEEIVNKCKMTFIKFFDRSRPPIYEKLTEKYAKKNSLERFLTNVDYDYNSDVEWEDDENADILDESSESEIIEEEDDLGFIDPSGEGVVIAKKASGPSVAVPILETKVYFDYRDFLNVPIFWHDEIPTELDDQFVSMAIEKKFSSNFLDEFSRCNFIKLKAVQKKARLLKKMRITEDVKN